MANKKAQVAIFVIIGILIIAAVVIYFLVRDRVGSSSVPKELEPAYNDFLNCLEDEATIGIGILGASGGYIDKPAFEPGSGYMPLSSQLDFLGTSVPYWYYISGNNIQEEQVPSLSSMQEQLENYIEEQISECNLQNVYNSGFELDFDFDNAASDVKISKDLVEVNLNLNLGITKGEDSVIVKTHRVEINSKLGEFYDYAKKIYNKERNDKFLEDYSVDVLRLYAPVDGVELSCSPLVWNSNEIKTDLVEALEVNVQTIKVKGDYYSLSSKENEYFVRDIGESADGKGVNFLYSKNWPTKIEIYPDKNPLIATPVGNQPELGILGFCYIPYHFVYDVAHPVLIQIYDEEELFQFPVAVIIDKNVPIKGKIGEQIREPENQLCGNKNQDINIYTYDNDLNSVEAEINFECLGISCGIGKTELNAGEASLNGKFPACVNGFVSASAEGYVSKRVMQSTNEEGSVNIILDRLYKVPYTVLVDGRETGDMAIINFVSESNSKTVVWPDMKEVELSEGQYNISVYVYSDSKITLPGIEEEQCSEVPKSGILGILGMTEEKCFDISLPSQKLSRVISAGGKGEDYLIESQLEDGVLEIKTNSIPLPRSLDELQDGYNLLEVQGVFLDFK